MGRRNRTILLGNNLPQLQNLIKRDSQSYEEEFLQQYRHFESKLSIFELDPSGSNNQDNQSVSNNEHKELGDIILFLAQVVKLYPEHAKAFPDTLIELLKKYSTVVSFDLRKSMVQALILLKNKGVVDSIKLLTLFFELFKCSDKVVRELIYSFIINDIKDANFKSKDNKLNKTLQNFLYSILQAGNNTANNVGGSNETAIAAKKSLQVCIELYRKNVWNDAKTVNVIAEACLSPLAKIVVTAVHFFLGANETEDDSDDELPDLKQLNHQSQINKKTKSRSRKREKAISNIRKREKKSKNAEVFNFSALHLIHDPQGFSEKLYARLHKSSSSSPDTFEVKLLIMKLIARVVGVHKLLLLGFYPYLLKYLQPHQRDVTQILALTAQACHELVPPDTLEPVIKAIADNFVNDTMANEVMSAGLNSIRELCTRAPLAMNETLLQDLTEYKSNRDKSVSMASRSIIQLFREINPSLLRKKDRGKDAVQKKIAGSEVKPLQYGQVLAADNISGTEFLDDGGSSGSDIPELEGEAASESDAQIGGDDSNDSEFEDELDEDCENDDPEVETIVEESEAPLQPADSIKKDSKPRVETLRILSEEDFKKIKRRQRAAALEQELGNPNSKKRNLSNESEEESESSDSDKGDPEIVDESAITRYRKKAKQDYQQRLDSIEAGREGRAKFGSNFSKKTEKHSTTNNQKKRNKSFMMLSHKKSVMLKSKMSLRDKQLQLRARIEKQKKRKH